MKRRVDDSDLRFGSKSKKSNPSFFLPTEIIERIFEFVHVEDVFKILRTSKDFNVASSSYLWGKLMTINSWESAKGVDAYVFCKDRVQTKMQIKKHLSILKPFIEVFREPDPKALKKFIAKVKDQNITLPYEFIALYEICDGFRIGEEYFTIEFKAISGIDEIPNYFEEYETEEIKEYAKGIHHQGSFTLNWLWVGSESEFDLFFLCCDAKNKDFGAFSTYVSNSPEGYFCAENLTDLFQSMYNRMTQLKKKFTNEQLKYLIEHRIPITGSIPVLHSVTNWSDTSEEINMLQVFDALEMDGEEDERPDYIKKLFANVVS
ncbi:ATP-dependent protease ATPase subunit HslU [Acrasis kona]|uniref:ATP-dependent protease ATPase subunit HslU n=1 Tax=Acrasis kona TaxID=1008807 RepID=A0AAW2ZKW6_9EUKA